MSGVCLSDEFTTDVRQVAPQLANRINCALFGATVNLRDEPGPTVEVSITKRDKNILSTICGFLLRTMLRIQNISLSCRILGAMAFAVTTMAGQTSARAAIPAAQVAAHGKVYVCPGAADGKEYDKPGFCGMSERVEKAKQLRVAVLMFKGAQLIDYAGPMEIFAQAGANVFTVAPTSDVRVSALGMLQFKPDYDFSNAPEADVLLVPGGNATEIASNRLESGQQSVVA